MMEEKVITPSAATTGQLLQSGTNFLAQRGVPSARLDAELLLSHVLGWSKETLWVNHRLPVDGAEAHRFDQALRRRAEREPVAYIIGAREFWSLEFLVNPEVLVPRPETEIVVQKAIDSMKKFEVSPSKLRILDIGTGSGVIAVSLARECGNVEIWATDISSGALAVAATNAIRHGVREKIHFLQGDLFEPVNGVKDSFDMIVSNPPYVRRGEIEGLLPDIRRWEPMSALDGGPDGLDFYRRIIGKGSDFLRDGAFMLLEIGADMGPEICELFKSVGSYGEIALHPDYGGRDRLVAARKRHK